MQILLAQRSTLLEARMSDGATALILAARHDLPHIVRPLLQAAVRVDGVDGQGEFGRGRLTRVWTSINNLFSFVSG